MTATIPAAALNLMAFIGSIEAPRGPDTVYGNNQAKLPKKLTSMTLDEVIKAGPWWTRKFGSSAAGYLQFMNRTLKGLKEEMDLTGRELFDRALQDAMGFHLLERRGWNLFVSGRISRTEFGKRLAMEWASFPVLADTKGAHRQLKRGDSYYRGDGVNKQLVTPQRVERMLDQVLKEARAEAAPVVVEKVIEKEVPVETVVEKQVVADPGEMETPTTKSKTFWTWLLTAIGAPLAAFGGLDWRVQLAIVAVIVGFAVYGIKRRNDLRQAVKRLRDDLSRPM